MTTDQVKEAIRRCAENNAWIDMAETLAPALAFMGLCLYIGLMVWHAFR